MKIKEIMKIIKFVTFLLREIRPKIDTIYMEKDFFFLENVFGFVIWKKQITYS